MRYGSHVSAQHLPTHKDVKNLQFNDALVLLYISTTTEHDWTIAKIFTIVSLQH